MRFELEHHFSHPIYEVVAAILDPDYQRSLDPIGPLKSRVLLSQEERDGGVVRRVRCVLEADLGGPVKAMLGDADPAWIEESVWAPEDTTWTWTILPEVAAGLISAGGSLALHPDGAGTTRAVTGDVRVNVPFVAGRIEQTIVDGVKQSYDEEAERLSRWLDARAQQPAS